MNNYQFFRKNIFFKWDQIGWFMCTFHKLPKSLQSNQIKHMDYNNLPLRLIDKNGGYNVTPHKIVVQMDAPFFDCRWSKLGRLRFIEVVSPLTNSAGILHQLHRIYGKDNINVLMHIICVPENYDSSNICLEVPYYIGDTLCGISVKFAQEHNILSVHSRNNDPQRVQFERVDSTTHRSKNINIDNQLGLTGNYTRHTRFDIITDSDTDVCEQARIICDMMIYSASDINTITSVYGLINVGLIYNDQEDPVPKRKLTKLKNKIRK